MRNRRRRVRVGNEETVAAQILSFWKTVMFASLAFAVMVTGIFVSSATGRGIMGSRRRIMTG